MNEQFEFFWQTESIYSNWHPSPFKAHDNLFQNSEQYFMWRKSMLFDDQHAAYRILTVKHPRDMKAIGRTIKNFDQTLWDTWKYSFMLQAIEYKFEQNPAFKDMLLSTAGKTLVEASPYDRVWGIGLVSSDPRALKRETWLGENLLGKALTEYRDSLDND